jgi:hypothetical protein
MHKSLVVKPEGKRPLRRPRYRGRTVFKETEWEVVDWIHVAQGSNQ